MALSRPVSDRQQQTEVDPVTVEIIRNAFIAAANDMNATLMRSAYTPIIYEAGDCSVALLDAQHKVLGQSAGLPLFLGNLEICIDVTEELLGNEIWSPGDVWIMNDSYLAGTHLNDVTVFAPIFYEDELVGFSASRAHWLDIGSKDPGHAMDASEIYQEGLRLGPVKVVEAGAVRRDIVDIIARNSRFPYPTVGDLHAQIAVTRTGERRLGELLTKFGPELVWAARDEIFLQSERIDRGAVTAIPDGTYRSEGYIDNDGLGDEPRWVRLEITVAGDSLTIDLRESSDSARGPVNCGEAQAVSACRVAFKLLLNPEQPVTGGTFKPLTVLVRKGSMLAAQEPAPCQYYFSSLGLLIDLFVKALAQVLPTRAAAAHYGDSLITSLSGLDRDGRLFVHNEALVGGWGAWQGSDGESALINAVNGSVRDFPIEIVESRLPVRVRRYQLRPDSAGDGQWRGGSGVIREYEINSSDVWLSAWYERSKMPAWGLLGGQSGASPYIVINPERPSERHLLKVNRLHLNQGDVVQCLSGGGGGYGDPSLRPTAIGADAQPVQEADATPGAPAPGAGPASAVSP